jgi:hypothetical protein
MRALIARDLADAGVAGLSEGRRFATAYNAALQAANMAIACAGYRIMSKVGHLSSQGDISVDGWTAGNPDDTGRTRKVGPRKDREQG